MSSRLNGSSKEDATEEISVTPLQLAIASLEKQYPEFSDHFSAASMSTRTQSIRTSDGVTNATSTVTYSDTGIELAETLAEVSMTIDRLLRLAPFLEQYLEGPETETKHGTNTLTSETIRREVDAYAERILTRFPQASIEHVRVIATARQRFCSSKEVDTRTDPQQRMDTHKPPPQATSGSNTTCPTPACEIFILDDTEIPYPSMPQVENGEACCSICDKNVSLELGIREWRQVTLF
jgi:hypothetical protein